MHDQQMRTLSILLTYRCTAQCSQCGTYSSPRDKGKISFEDVRPHIISAKEMGFANVVFTGGEATLEWDSLCRGIGLANSLGLCPRLVTNAHWATDDAASHKAVNELVDAGLNEINYSTGDEHQRFVPLSNIVRAVHASLGVPIRTVLMYEDRQNPRVTYDEVVRQVDAAAGHHVSGRDFLKYVRSPWMPLNPYAAKDFCVGERASQDSLALYGGCDSVLQTYTLQGDGKISACCGLGSRFIPELHVGEIAGVDLKTAIAEAEDDLLKQAIKFIGPIKILAWAATIDRSIQWESIYSHRCQACMRLYKDVAVRKVLRERLFELVPDMVASAAVESINLDETFDSEEQVSAKRFALPILHA